MESYQDATLPLEERVSALLACMTADEKIGQMTQVQKGAIRPDEVRAFFIGSILSGGGGFPDNNTPVAWLEMTSAYQDAALGTRLAIPLLYGADGVHGHNNVYGATIFPHNIGLGATRAPALVERVGRATAREMIATGVPWNFAPMVAVPQDLRWGRTYEGYGEDTALVSEFGAAFVHGFITPGSGDTQAGVRPIATAKHFLGDGGTLAGTSAIGVCLLDQGDARYSERRLRELFIPPYQSALAAGARTVMASLSSWNGTKLHGQRHLLTKVLKGELGFTGFVISDWGALNELPGADYYAKVVHGINAGVDMVMVPDDYRSFISAVQNALQKGDITSERIDDAVRRILRVKFESGIFEQAFPDPSLLATVGCAQHRAVARDAVRQSLVLLKNDKDLLPLPKNPGMLLVAGRGADDVGLQCGGWTIEWKGASGKITPGTSLLGGIQLAVEPGTQVLFDPKGNFDVLRAQHPGQKIADVAVIVLAEDPYAEWFGDTATLTLGRQDAALIVRVKELAHKVVVILLAGRPAVVRPYLAQWDALVAAWLPGTEGAGVADVLFGDAAFSGTLPYSWPASEDEARLPDIPNGRGSRSEFPFGFGLTTKIAAK